MMARNMQTSPVQAEGVVVTPIRLEDGNTGLFAYFKAAFVDIDECDCLAFGALGVEMIDTLKECDKITVSGALYCDSNDRKSLYIFDIEKT